MAHSNVPKFGNWESEDNVPYTVYFDKARKNKNGKMINPNDPKENPELFPNVDPPLHGPKPLTPERRVSKEEGDFRHFTNSPARGENTGQKSTNESNYGGQRGQRPARSTRASVGSEQSFEKSPLHQAKVTGRGGGSPAWDGRNHDSSHGTPSRSRLRPTTRGDESPDEGTAVPRFGEWDESDPQPAENYSHIFNKVREERNMAPGNVIGTPMHPSYGGRNQHSNEPKKCCCPWW